MNHASSSLFQQYLEIIGKSELFSGLPVELCSDIIAHGQHRSFARDQFLLHQGDRPHYTAFILKGNLITLRSNSDGDETVIRLLGSGETCMEAILFPHCGPSPISVRAVRASEVLCIDAQYLIHLAESNARFANNLIHILARHYRNAMQQIDAITIQDAQARLGQYLLNHYLQSESDEEFVLTFRKVDIAHHLGMTPETLSRTFKQLQKNGVNLRNRDVALCHPHALCQFCSVETSAQCPLLRSQNCPLKPRKSGLPNPMVMENLRES